jgi:hypothetical protein
MYIGKHREGSFVSVMPKLVVGIAQTLYVMGNQGFPLD